MRPILLLSIVLLVSCGSKSSSVKFGKTTRSDIVALKQAEPEREEKIPTEQGSVMVYGDETYQLKADIVTHMNRAPKGDEVNLIFWKHRFKECKTTLREVPLEPGSHVPPELQLDCAELGEAVVYTKGNDLVRRIMVYEAK